MKPESLIELCIKHGHTVTRYEDHVMVTKKKELTVDVTITVTIPTTVGNLAKRIVDIVKKLLDL